MFSSPFPLQPPSRIRAMATSLLVNLVIACSGSTEGGGGNGGASGSASSGVAAGGSGDGTALTPGLPGGADAGDGAAGDVSGAAAQGGGGGSAVGGGPPLAGPAFFDFDCGEGGALPPGNACATCEVSSCAAELKAALGANWTAGMATGPCKGWFDCIQACTCNDQACYKSCTPKLGEGNCEAPFAKLDGCITDQCQSLCSSSSSG